MFKRDWTTSSRFQNYSIINSEHNWGGPKYPMRNQQTCTSNYHNQFKGCLSFNPVFVDGSLQNCYCDRAKAW